MADQDTQDQLERIRSKAYAIASENPGSPEAERARHILSKLPTISVGRNMDKELATAGSFSPSGSEASGEELDLPPTADEQVGLPNEVKRPPIGTRMAAAVGNPGTRRQFLRGVHDYATLGAGNKLAQLIDPKFSADQEKADASESPEARPLGQLFGALTPGGASMRIGGAALKLVNPIAKLGTGYAGKMLTGGLAGAAANEIAVPAIEGGRAAIHGDNPLPAMRDVATSPATPLVGAGLGLLAGGARGIHDSPGQVGRDIRLVEQYAGQPTPIGGAKGGVFDSPLLADLEGSDREVGTVSRKAAQRVLGGLQEEQSGLGKQYAAAKAEAAQLGHLEGRVSGEEVVSEAQKLVSGERLTGAQKALIQREVIDTLQNHPNGMTVDDFNDFRAKLSDLAQMGPDGPSNQAMGNLFHAAKSAVDDTEMGPINRAYHEGRTALEGKYRSLKLKPDTDQRVAEERLANLIARRGENTVTAGVQDPEVEAFLEANPKYRAMFDSASLLRAKERMSAGLIPEGGGFFRRNAGHHLLEKNLEPLQVLGYRLGQPLDKGAVAAALGARLLLGQGSQ